MIGDAVVVAGEAVRKEVSARRRNGFTRAALAAAVSRLTAARADTLIHEACAMATQIEVMSRAGRSVVNDILGSAAIAQPWEQYPQPMVEDAHIGVGYFYHSHGLSLSHLDERGHFHVFVRGVDAAYSHLAGIAVDVRGMPVRLFTTNRWVTDERWMTAERLLKWAKPYSHHSEGSGSAVTLWVMHCVHLFYPQLEWLLHRRDERLDSLTTSRCSATVFKDRRIEILSECEVSFRRQIGALLDG
jgi:hypothetical protein